MHDLTAWLVEHGAALTALLVGLRALVKARATREAAVAGAIEAVTIELADVRARSKRFERLYEEAEKRARALKVELDELRGLINTSRR